MRQYILNVMNPDCYHGAKRRPPFFEGWYYKLVTPDLQSIAIIPGIYKANASELSGAFIQILDQQSLKNYYLDFPLSAFTAKPQKLDIAIAKNHFTESSLILNLHQKNLQITGNLIFRNLFKWPVTFFSPGIMGWYAWTPLMQCYHGVVSMDHNIGGSLRINETEYCFDGGRGYTEKDWGSSFPDSWVWMQTNHFGEPGVGLTLSIAIIPWINGAFPGFICGFLLKGKLFKFATYTGAKITFFKANKDHADIVIEDNKHRLEVAAERNGNSATLLAPTQKGMTRKIQESLDAKISLKLWRLHRSGNNLIFEGTGEAAGFEAEGNLINLTEMWLNNHRGKD
jgi:hypothetical protein